MLTARWRHGEAWDSRYDDLQNQLREIENLRTPGLMIQGLSDHCDPPGESEGLEGFFTGGYRRLSSAENSAYPDCREDGTDRKMRDSAES